MNSTKSTAKKKLHDLESAIFTLRQAVAELKEGYRFDDRFAAAKIDSLSRASTKIIEAAQEVISDLKDADTTKTD